MRKYIKYIDPDQRHWPLLPVIVLFGTNDPRVPRAELHDPRLLAPTPVAEGPGPSPIDAINPVINLFDWKNRVE